MSFLVDVVFLGRRMTPDATTLQVVYLFTTGPELATRISVLDWGTGAAGEITPSSPSAAFTYDAEYLGGSGGPSTPLFGAATFAAQVFGTPGYVGLVNVRLALDPDAVTGGIYNGAAFTDRQLIVMGTNDDRLSGGLAQDTIHAGGGDDVVIGGAGRDILYGETGADTLIGGLGTDLLYGNAGADSLSGDADHDYLQGGLGDDTLLGGAGQDDLAGDAGDDQLRGGSGNDYLAGGDGADSMFGDSGDDRLFGEGGGDLQRGGAGGDSLWGGLGDDTLLGDAGGDMLQGDEGQDILNGGVGTDTLFGGADQDRLLGGAGNDLLYGDEGNDVLLGGDGDDFMMGNIGRDVLAGGAGADTFFGSVDADVLITSADGVQDTFMYINPTAENDIIRGFVSGEDVVRLFFGTPGPVIQGADPVAGVGEAAALFDTDNGRLYYDIDGAGGEAAVLIATLFGITSLQAGDVIFG